MEEVLGVHRRDGVDEFQIAVMHHTAPCAIITAHLIRVAAHKDLFYHPLDAEWHVVAHSNRMNTIHRTIVVPAPLDPPYVTLVEHRVSHLGQLCADRARTWYQ